METPHGHAGTDIPFENRIASVFVHVTDLRRAAEWYSTLLGLPLMEERLNGGPVYWFDLPGTGLVLDSNTGNARKPGWREEMKPRFMFPVADIDRAYAYVQTQSSPFFEPERFGTLAYFNFRDPEGHAVMACWTAASGSDTPLTESGSPILARIGGVFLGIENMELTARWYSDLLGTPLEEAEPARSVHVVPVSRGASLLLDGECRSESALFFLETNDLQASLAYAREQGFEVEGSAQQSHNMSMFVLADPDGNRVMVRRRL